ncbi:hypothetical protein OA44_23350 [Enterobacter cloacae]|jgi:hypothetical protein|nr:hypothetical protein TN43_08055 [Enterobacter hormaechei]KKY76202.1 hypothetical protein OA44_23350 [Enterobacter cloacae]SAD51447.1 Uncharacterised protein [Enterobacter cloacae]
MAAKWRQAFGLATKKTRFESGFFLKIHVPLPILSRMWGRRRNHIRLYDMPNKCFMRDKSTTAVDILALVVTFFGCC